MTKSTKGVTALTRSKYFQHQNSGFLVRP